MKLDQAPAEFLTTITFDAISEADAIVNALDRQVAEDAAIDVDYWRGARLRLKQLTGVIMSTNGGTASGGTVDEIADALYGRGRWTLPA